MAEATEEDEFYHPHQPVAIDPSLLFEREETATYVDDARAAQDMEDIKTALDKAKKKYGDSFGKFRRQRPNVDDYDNLLTDIMTEEEFQQTGGMRGYIERARALFVRGKFAPAVRYLDFAIAQGQQFLGAFEDEEDKELLEARTLKAKCLLKEAYYGEAATESDKIIEVSPNNVTALFVKAEARFNQVRNFLLKH